MASPKIFLLYFVVIFFTISKIAIIIEAEEDEHGLDVVNEDFELPMSMSLYEGENRRSLFWHKTFKYYISYGALSANRIPCPPRSGRSYYTHHCFSAHGPAHPYTRGCSAITRCRR
ncbi:protein RALF-like 34 [Nicotiana sylvestris]|uniref:Protein RALF-like 34 n=2 Tax=Nicotiana TaxID=4085 RepID=A0A1S4B774_TOBAC|nr:PREDICTED: protein RALF-like 34 [Nicotiana sylvestris]XP_016484697.1 PREDICTED: protein RALF-like 34 [Nicotiana tabacum]